MMNRMLGRSAATEGTAKRTSARNGALMSADVTSAACRCGTRDNRAKEAESAKDTGDRGTRVHRAVRFRARLGPGPAQGHVCRGHGLQSSPRAGRREPRFQRRRRDVLRGREGRRQRGRTVEVDTGPGVWAAGPPAVEGGEVPD